MRLLILLAAVGLQLTLSACGQTFNRTALEADSTRDDPYIAKEYGDAAPTPVTVNRQGKSLSFAVRVGRIHPRVLVEGSDEAKAAAAGSVNRMTFGVVKEGLDDDAFREAALSYLASSGKRDCKLLQGGQTGGRFEWTYRCQT